MANKPIEMKKLRADCTFKGKEKEPSPAIVA